MTLTSLGDIMAEMQAMRNQNGSRSRFVSLRHKLTKNIEFNLYGGGSKDEGRKALAIRGALDEMIFRATSEDLVEGDGSGLDYMKRAITLETLGERMEILEEISKNAKGTGRRIKLEMINLLIDPDRFGRFIPSHQSIMKSAASGSVFLARWRFNKIVRSIQGQMKEVVDEEQMGRAAAG